MPLRRAILAGLACLLAAAAAFGAEGRGDEGELGLTVLTPPLLKEGPSPAVLYKSLTPSQARSVSKERHVLTLEETTRKEGGELVMRVLSLGVLDVPLERAVEVFRDVSRYPEWLVLNPSYKEVNVVGKGLVEVAIGKASQDEVKTHALYRVETAGDPSLLWEARWNFAREVRAFQKGSFLDYTLQALPGDPGRTLVLHTQETRVDGLLAKHYLTGETDDGHTRHWQDASRHARRIHWAAAVEAAGIHGADARRDAYASHYVREFGHLP